MRQIEYIFIDSNRETRDGKSSHNAIPNLGYHYVVNSQGLVLNPTDTSIPAHIIHGPNYDRNKYNRYSIFIRYCGSLEPGTLNFELRIALLNLLVELRQRFPNAKILGVSELDITSSHAPVRVNPWMNELRSQLSDLP
jgi:hypothetical protein